MPQLSKKGIELPTSPIRKLVVFSENTKANGFEVLHLNIGQPDIAAPKEAIEAGSDYLVIGRPITQAQNPVQVLSDVNKSIA